MRTESLQRARKRRGERASVARTADEKREVHIPALTNAGHAAGMLLVHVAVRVATSLAVQAVTLGSRVYMQLN